MDHWRSFFNFIWQVQSGRRLVPTALGITLVRGYQCIDPDLCLPDIRGFIEHQITLIAKGQADHSLVVKHVLEQFKQKFVYFVKQVSGIIFHFHHIHLVSVCMCVCPPFFPVFEARVG